MGPQGSNFVDLDNPPPPGPMPGGGMLTGPFDGLDSVPLELLDNAVLIELGAALPIPTTSYWGMIAISLLLLAGFAIKFGWRRATCESE